MRKLSLSQLNRLSVEEYKKISKLPVVVLLDNIRSGMNVGSAFRTADAFKMGELALCGITQKPPHREILKTAIGANQSVSWRYFETTLEAVNYYKNLGYHIVIVEQTNKSTPLQDWQIDKNAKIVFVFGNEIKGVSENVLDLADAALEIPQYGTKHSLNISVAVGIVLWEYIRAILN